MSAGGFVIHKLNFIKPCVKFDRHLVSNNAIKLDRELWWKYLLSKNTIRVAFVGKNWEKFREEIHLFSQDFLRADFSGWQILIIGILYPN